MHAHVYEALALLIESVNYEPPPFSPHIRSTCMNSAGRWHYKKPFVVCVLPYNAA